MNGAAPITRQIEPELLERLGLFIVRWSLVEACVSDLFVLLTGGNPGSMIVVTSSISTSTITDWIRALIETHQKTPHDLVNEINDVLTEVDHLRSERNILVHGLWETTGPANSVVVQTVRLGRNEIIRGRVVTASDLDSIIDDTLEVTSKLLFLIKNIVPMG
jgi:hypothetical protein